MGKHVIELCETCWEQITLVGAKNYGDGVSDQCEYRKEFCKLCCDCGGHQNNKQKPPLRRGFFICLLLPALAYRHHL